MESNDSNRKDGTVDTAGEQDVVHQDSNSSPVEKRKSLRTTLVVLLGFAIAMTFGAQLLTLLFADDIESIISRDGLRPIRPISNTYSVGDLHTVDLFGRVGNAICHSEYGETLRGKGEEKIVGSVVVSEGEIEAGESQLSGGAGGQSLVKLDVRLNNIMFISARSESDLHRFLYEKLIYDDACQDQIQQKIKAGFCLAQIYSIMIADGSYALNGSSVGSISLEPSNAINAQIRTELGFDESVFKIGKELHYGVKMGSLCVTPNDAILVRTVPDNRFWVFAPFLNVFHTAWNYMSEFGTQLASNPSSNLTVARFDNK